MEERLLLAPLLYALLRPQSALSSSNASNGFPIGNNLKCALCVESFVRKIVVQDEYFISVLYH